jgi:hypothetical protein
MVDTDVSAYPNTHALLKALDYTEDKPYALSIINAEVLTLKSGKFQAKINCADPEHFNLVRPDPFTLLGDNAEEIRDGLSVLSSLVSENSQRVVNASFFVTGESFFAADSHALYEYWHGLKLPHGLILPKSFMNAVAKIRTKIVGYGFSASTFTLFYENDSWIKTQQYQEKWPDVQRIINCGHKLSTISDDFREGLALVASFHDRGLVTLSGGNITPQVNEQAQVTFACATQEGEATFRAKHLLPFLPKLTHIDFNAELDRIYVSGEKLRGVVSKVKSYDTV